METHDDADHQRHDDHPSMGPPPFGDGNIAPDSCGGRACSASMGPPPFGDGNVPDSWVPISDHTPLQWGHRLSAMETRCPVRPSKSLSDCFNGATAFRRWKQAATDLKVANSSTASMGPPPFGDGNRTSATSPSSIFPRLQWGHRLSAMETGAVLVAGHHPKAASMGPPPFGDGNDGIHAG